jgi:hypothetical protein
VAAALIDGVDLPVVAAEQDPAEPVARRLTARARERGCVVVPTRPWPGCDLVIERITQSWTGLGHGRGRLRRQQVTLRAAGRGRAARPRTAALQMPPPSLIGTPAAPIIPPTSEHEPLVPAELPAVADASMRIEPTPEPEPDLWSVLMRQIPPPPPRTHRW